MMLEEDCPLDIVEESTKLASRIEVEAIPLDFDPGNLLWQDILSRIAREFSNHETLLSQLEDFLVRTEPDLCDGCRDPVAGAGSESCETCSERWLAEHRLWEAALAGAEKAYQRWLARQALRRAASQQT
jgi:hypothetical protein